MQFVRDVYACSMYLDRCVHKFMKWVLYHDAHDILHLNQWAIANSYTWDETEITLTHWRLGDFNKILYVIFKWILVIDRWGISFEIALILMSLDCTDDQSTLLQAMAGCRQATSHYLSQCWPRYMTPYDVTRPQWVKDESALENIHCRGLQDRNSSPELETEDQTIIGINMMESYFANIHKIIFSSGVGNEAMILHFSLKWSCHCSNILQEAKWSNPNQSSDMKHMHTENIIV